MAKIRVHIQGAESDAQDRVDQAQEELDAEVAKATDLTGITDPDRLLGLAAKLAAEQQRHEAELAALLEG
jgi:hypothetical protein